MSRTRKTSEQLADDTAERIAALGRVLAALEVDIEAVRTAMAALDHDADELRSEVRWTQLGAQLAAIAARVAAARAGL